MKIRLLSAFFLLYCQFGYAQTQLALMSLCKDVVGSNNGIQLDNFSTITDGSVGPNTVKLRRLPQQQDGYLEMTLHTLQGSMDFDISVSLQQVGNQNNLDRYQLQMTKSGDNIAIVATEPNGNNYDFGSDFQDGTVIKIERCANDIVFRIGAVEHIVSPMNDVQAQELEAFFSVNIAQEISLGECPKVELAFPKISPTPKTQLALLDVCRNSGGQDGGNIQVDPFSCITDGSVTSNTVKLRRLPAQQDGYLELIANALQNSPDYDITVSLQEFGNPNPSECYKFQLTKSSTGIAINALGVNNSYHNFGNNFQDGTVLQIERCANTIVFRVDNAEHIITPMIDVQSQKLEAILTIDVAEPINTDCLQLEFTFPQMPTNKTYVALSPKENGSYIDLDGNTQIRFRYDEMYAIVDAENETVECNIFDWERQSPSGLPMSLDNRFGTNWQILDLSDLNLITDAFYTLEVTGLNKGATYYLRFKY